MAEGTHLAQCVPSTSASFASGSLFSCEAPSCDARLADMLRRSEQMIAPAVEASPHDRYRLAAVVRCPVLSTAGLSRIRHDVPEHLVLLSDARMPEVPG